MGLFSFLFGARSPAATQAAQPRAAAAGRGLRMRWLTALPAELGVESTPEFPRVHGVLMDLPISGGQTATVAASATGAAGLYTTGSFGIGGGEGHAAVRAAALRFTQAAEAVHDAASPAAEFPYPVAGRVRFYLLTYAGVRCIETDMDELANPQGACTDLFICGQAVMTELRLTAAKKC